jgi:hypothetical protein
VVAEAYPAVTAGDVGITESEHSFPSVTCSNVPRSAEVTAWAEPDGLAHHDLPVTVVRRLCSHVAAVVVLVVKNGLGQISESVKFIPQARRGHCEMEDGTQAGLGRRRTRRTLSRCLR